VIVTLFTPHPHNALWLYQQIRPKLLEAQKKFDKVEKNINLEKKD
jgi:hypothetical protein